MPELCITEDWLRRNRRAYAYTTPGYDNSRIISFDEYVGRYPIDPTWAGGQWLWVCASPQNTLYSHYEGEFYASGTVLGYFDNSSGTGFIAGYSSLGTMQWSPHLFANAGASSTTDSYDNTYKIMQRYYPPADAPAGYNAYSSNAGGCNWVLPSPYHAIFINLTKNVYGGWAGVSSIWTSMEGSNPESDALYRQFGINLTLQTLKNSSSHAVIPFRTYDDGPVIAFFSISQFSNDPTTHSVRIDVQLRGSQGLGSANDSRTHASEQYTLNIGYTDPDNHSNWLDQTTQLSYSIALQPSTSAFWFIVTYPKDASLYNILAGVYWNANWGVVGSNTGYTIPAL